MAKSEQVTLSIRLWEDGTKKLPADLSDISELLAPHVEHVAGLCEQGYISGEIVIDGYGGWWEMERENT